MTTLLHVLTAAALAQVPTDLVAIGGGTYRPLYPPDPAVPEAVVAPFRVEAHPVTVDQFRAFVLAHPEWAPGAVPALRADQSYLSRWSSPTPPTGKQPVTEVSWFAARAYCTSLGRRLPTEDEWELVARASTDLYDASDDEAWLAEILAWYGRPSGGVLADVQRGPPNKWGVYDLHGLVWEWVDDFNNTLVAADVREAGDEDRARFCGVGAVSAQDVKDYANFMRVAWRSALEGKTTTRNLGFRCAADEEGP